MPLTIKTEKVTEEGVSKEALVFTFTNGAKDQLAILTKHFKQQNELELIKLGISLLQKFKEEDEAKLK